MKISFHGADRDVTGSCHLLEAAGKRILIDCGLYQGSRELDVENGASFDFEADAIDFLLLTHAHLDHCGRIPLLVKRGFKGEIVTTAPTRELAKLVMLDAARLQDEDAQHASRHGAHPHADASQPLYTELDAFRAMDCFGRVACYGEAVELAPGLTATFYDAGHILGSASIRVVESGADGTRSIVFSGDLGNGGHPILRDPQPPPHADAVVMETTYGDRLHKGIGPSVEELYAAIEDTRRRGGNVVIPTFALERAQELLYYLREGVERGRLPRDLPVFLDSPMAISATEIFRRHPDFWVAKDRTLFAEGHDPFALPGLRFTRESSDSRAINDTTGGAVIMAGSGMCTGGRVRHHLSHNLGRADSSVVFVGYAAAGTLARQLIDGAKSVRLFHEQVPVRARLHTINGFSAHADQNGLLAWHGAIQPAKTILVHGDDAVMRRFAQKLHGSEVLMPALGDSYAL